VWTGSTNAVQLQIYATLIFYAVLLTIQQFPLMACESYVTMAADSSLSVSTIRVRLLKSLL